MKAVAFGLVVAVSASGPSLLYVGDWGGSSDSHPTTAAEITTAGGMAKKAKELSADGVLLLGDNFYTHGVKSADSSRFVKTFEEVFANFGDTPFHVIAGNHDHEGNAQAQVEYSAKSSHWNFPSLYYTLDWDWNTDSGEKRSAQIVMTDTVDLAGHTVDRSGVPPSGPRNLTCAADQWSWLEKQLSESTADFWVAGHYPIYSAGDDGTTSELVDRLLPLLKQYGAHYICGHDHMAQHLDMEGVQQFQNGMGKECCYGTGNMHTVPDGYIKYLISGSHGQGTHIGGDKPPSTQGGFNTMEFRDEAVTITSFTEGGIELYSAKVPRRNSDALV